jgi:DMSO/TMAO reductase YedYZ heme-binding membrane subunit
MKIEYIHIIWNKKINSGQINFYAIYAVYLSDNSAENK